MDEALRQLVAQGLAALKAGGEIAAGATDEIRNDARDPELRQALEQGNQTAQQWAQRVDRALDEVGGYDRAENPIVRAHYEVSKKIRGEAADDRSRDLNQRPSFSLGTSVTDRAVCNLRSSRVITRGAHP